MLEFVKAEKNDKILNRAQTSDLTTGWNRYKEAQGALKVNIRSTKCSLWKLFQEEIKPFQVTPNLKRILAK